MILQGLVENTSIPKSLTNSHDFKLTIASVIAKNLAVVGGGGSQLVNILCCPLLLEIVLLIMTGGGH